MDPATIGLIAALVGSGGLGFILKDALVSLFKFLAGMSAREQNRKKDIVQEREEAISERDSEAKNRRMLEEALAEIRRKAITDWNVPQADLPKWPEYHTLTRGEVRRMASESGLDKLP